MGIYSAMFAASMSNPNRRSRISMVKKSKCALAILVRDWKTGCSPDGSKSEAYGKLSAWR